MKLTDEVSDRNSNELTSLNWKIWTNCSKKKPFLKEKFFFQIFHSSVQCKFLSRLQSSHGEYFPHSSKTIFNKTIGQLTATCNDFILLICFKTFLSALDIIRKVTAWGRKLHWSSDHSRWGRSCILKHNKVRLMRSGVYTKVSTRTEKKYDFQLNKYFYFSIRSLLVYLLNNFIEL